MKSNTMKTTLRLFALSLLVPGLLLAAPGDKATEDVVYENLSLSHITMSGSVGYSISGGTATLTVDQINNNGSTSTDTIYLKLWATTDSSPEGSGYTIAEAAVGSLGPGGSFHNVSESTSESAPPDGTYYFHMLLVEGAGSTTYSDSLTFDEQETYDSGSTGGGGGDDGGSDDGGGALHPLLLLIIGMIGLLGIIRRRQD